VYAVEKKKRSDQEMVLSSYNKRKSMEMDERKKERKKERKREREKEKAVFTFELRTPSP